MAAKDPFDTDKEMSSVSDAEVNNDDVVLVPPAPSKYKSFCFNQKDQYSDNGLSYLKSLKADQLKSLEIFALEEENPEALFDLATCYRFGFHVKINIIKAFELTEKAINNGMKKAVAVIGDYYTFPKVIAHLKLSELEAKQKAFEFYEKAAEMNYVLAQYSLAEMYRNENDLKKAFEWYQRAAEQGFEPALHAVGVSYEKNLGVPLLDEQTRLATAKKYYGLAAEKGYNLSKTALDNLGLQNGSENVGMNGHHNGHPNGNHLGSPKPKKPEKSGKDAKESSEQKKSLEKKLVFDASYTSAFLQNGQYSESGHQILKKHISRLKSNEILNFELQGFDENTKPDILFDLAICYRFGYKFNVNLSTTFALIKRSAEKGFPLAEWILGELYILDIGVPSEERAKREELGCFWYERAAKKELLIAHHDLALYLIKNPKKDSDEIQIADLKIAKKHLEYALEKGFEKAKIALEELATSKFGASLGFTASDQFPSSKAISSPMPKSPLSLSFSDSDFSMDFNNGSSSSSSSSSSSLASSKPSLLPAQQLPPLQPEPVLNPVVNMEEDKERKEEDESAMFGKIKQNVLKIQEYSNLETIQLKEMEYLQSKLEALFQMIETRQQQVNEHQAKIRFLTDESMKNAEPGSENDEHGINNEMDCSVEDIFKDKRDLKDSKEVFELSEMGKNTEIQRKDFISKLSPLPPMRGIDPSKNMDLCFVLQYQQQQIEMGSRIQSLYVNRIEQQKLNLKLMTEKQHDLIKEILQLQAHIYQLEANVALQKIKTKNKKPDNFLPGFQAQAAPKGQEDSSKRKLADDDKTPDNDSKRQRVSGPVSVSKPSLSSASSSQFGQGIK